MARPQQFKGQDYRLYAGGSYGGGGGGGGGAAGVGNALRQIDTGPAYGGPPMVNPYVPMQDNWGGVDLVGSPGQYMGGINMVRGGGYYGQGIPLVKAGEYYGRGIDMVKNGAYYGKGIDIVNSGQSYFGGMYMPQQGSKYFNNRTIDIVDKAGDYAGLEAETGRLMSRAGGALGADLAMQGLSGGPTALARRQAGVSEAVGNLANEINADKFARESAVQQGTLARQQGVLAGDVARSQADYQKRSGILQGDTSRMQGQLGRNQLVLSGDTARMQGQLSRNQLILGGDTARQQGAISRNQLMLSGDTARMQGQLSRNQLGLQADLGRQQGTMGIAQGRSSDQQFGLGLGYQYNSLNSQNYWNWQDNTLAREQLYSGNLQNPEYGNTGDGRK